MQLKTLFAVFSLALVASVGVQVVAADPANAACLTATKWYTTPGKYGINKKYVKVKNNCSSSKRFKIDIKNWPDKGPFTVKGKTTRTVFYGNTNSPKGRKIYEVR